MNLGQLTDVAIVGGGASGVLCAVNLLRRARRPMHLVVVDEHGRLGQGLAYSTRRAEHVLNVPVEKMSAFREDPDHFLRWMTRVDPTTLRGTFAPRFRFGEYLQAVLRETLERAPSGTTFRLRRARAVGLARAAADAFQLELDRGPAVAARQVVLAMGNLDSAAPIVQLESLESSPFYCHSPWEHDWLYRLKPTDTVLLIGTGLSMVDAVLALHSIEHPGEIEAVSRHGLLPLAQRAPAPPRASLPRDFARSTLRRQLRSLRAAASREESLGGDWRSLIDGLRSQTPSIWQRLSTAERQRFLRHLRAYWDIHRHRMPPAAEAVIGALKAKGKLRVRAGRIRRAAVVEDAVEVHLQPRGSTKLDTLRVSRLVNCTGSARELRHTSDPLIQSLLRDGLARADELGIALDTDSSGRVLCADGPATEGLYALGPLRRGTLWESTAIPEIRSQAAQLAIRLLEI